MPDTELKQQLEKLRLILAGAEELPRETREELEHVVADISTALEDEPPRDLVDRINSVIEDFEAHHPTLTDLLRRIVEGLANMGI